MVSFRASEASRGIAVVPTEGSRYRDAGDSSTAGLRPSARNDKAAAIRRAGLVVTFLAGLTACSKATQSDPTPPTPQSSRIVIGGGETVTLPTGAEAVVARSSIVAPLADVWNALPSVYADLGIVVEMVNPTEYRIGNQALKARRRIGQLQMIRLLSCGGTIGAPNAETFDITMYVVSQISAGQAGTTNLATVVQAVGKSPNFGGNDVSCTSLGALEKRIEELVRGKVKK